MTDSRIDILVIWHDWVVKYESRGSWSKCEEGRVRGKREITLKGPELRCPQNTLIESTRISVDSYGDIRFRRTSLENKKGGRRH